MPCWHVFCLSVNIFRSDNNVYVFLYNNNLRKDCTLARYLVTRFVGLAIALSRLRKGCTCWRADAFLGWVQTSYNKLHIVTATRQLVCRTDAFFWSVVLATTYVSQQLINCNKITRQRALTRFGAYCYDFVNTRHISFHNKVAKHHASARNLIYRAGAFSFICLNNNNVLLYMNCSQRIARQRVI